LTGAALDSSFNALSIVVSPAYSIQTLLRNLRRARVSFLALITSKLSRSVSALASYKCFITSSTVFSRKPKLAIELIDFAFRMARILDASCIEETRDGATF